MIGFGLAPKLSHSELGTDLGLKSGNSPETNRFSFWFGGETKLARENQLFWQLNFSLEKNIFSGSANEIDPISNTTPTGVSVLSGWTLLKFGYRWGR